MANVALPISKYLNPSWMCLHRSGNRPSTTLRLLDNLSIYKHFMGQVTILKYSIHTETCDNNLEQPTRKYKYNNILV